jgi:T-complex protein 1 subunit gamma
MAVARNVVFDPRLVPGGGASEMAVGVGLQNVARSVEGVQGWAVRAVAEAMEVVPRTLVQNAGGNAMRVLTELRVRSSCCCSLFFVMLTLCRTLLSHAPTQAKHAAGEHSFGINGDTGKLADMKQYGLYESASVKVQILKTAIEVRCVSFIFFSFPSALSQSLDPILNASSDTTRVSAGRTHAPPSRRRRTSCT